MKIIKKIVLSIICLSMILTTITSINAFELDTEDLDFHAFLSDYLYDNYLYEKLDDPMAHHYLHEAMTQEFGDTNVTLTLVNIANDWGYALKGKTTMYEQIILEMLVNYVNSDVFKNRVEEDKVQIENDIFDYLKKSFDFGYLADDLSELYSILKKTEFKTWKDISKVPDEVFNKSLTELIKHNKIPVSKSYKLNVAYDFIDLMTKAITYMSVCNQVDGIKDVLEEMARYCENKDMRSAIIRILNKLNAVHPNDIWSGIEANSLEFAFDSIITFTKDMVLTCFDLVGLSIETGGFISNIVFKTDEIAKSYVLLKSEIEIENVIKKVIKIKQNTYMTNKEDAKILNYSLLLLYDAYEYGLNLTKKYGQNVLYVDYFRNLLKIQSNDENNQYTEFINKVKTWDGIVANHRSLFESGWLEYKALHMKNLGSLENAFHDYVSGIYFEKSSIVVELDDAKQTYPLNACKNMPNNISMTYTYTSSDPSIVSIENKNIYSIKAHKAGTVTITAKSEDGFHRATQTIIIVDGGVNENKKFEVEKDYSDYYHDNQDGITLTGIVKDFIEYNWNSDLPTYVYRIPSTINGKTVTELDFSKVRMREYPDADTNFFDQVIIPDTVKRIADGCFSHGNVSYECEYILPEGIEEIGANAFRFVTFVNRNIVLPTTLKKIGEGAFENSIYDTIYINCPYLTEISKNCFDGNLYLKQRVIFSNDMKQLKKIGEHALSDLEYVLLPDCVEILEKRSLAYSRIDHLPASLREIGEECFYQTKISIDQLPSNVKKVGKKAFYYNKIETLSIPNNIEFIGENAFGHIQNIILYGESSSSSGTIEGYIGHSTYFEIPHSITNIGMNFMPENIVWTNGMNIIQQEPKKEGIIYGKKHTNLYLTNIERQGSYALENHIFNPSTYFDYIEIPTNYLENTKQTLYGDWIFNCVIVGNSDEIQLNKYVEILKDAIDVGGSITHCDDQGNLTLLYQNLPLSFTKTSKAVYENQKDYIVSPIELLKYQKGDVVSDLKVILSSDSNVEKLELQCWEEGNETKSQRMNELGDFMIFEDIYLYQPFHRYFTISSDAKGPYVVSLEFEGYELTKDNVGLYHISENGIITRIPLQYEKLSGYDKKISFKTDRLGQFTLVKLLYKEEKILTSYRDEYLFEDEEKVIDEKNPVIYDTDHGNQSFISKDEDCSSTIIKPSFETSKDDNDSHESDSHQSMISKPIKDKIKEEIIQDFKLDDSLINKNKDSVLITEESLESKDQWEMISQHSVMIQSDDNSKIHIALNKADNHSYDFYVYKMDEDGTLEQMKNPIRSIKDKKVNPNLLDINHEYFELKLNKGQYFITYLESEKETSLLNVIWNGIKIFACIIGVIFMGLISFILIGEKLTKRRRRRKRR